MKDITKLGLEEFTERLLDTYETDLAARVALSVKAMSNKHAMNVREAVRIASERGEEGSDGIEEGLIEQGLEFDLKSAEKLALAKIDKVSMFNALVSEHVLELVVKHKLYDANDWFFQQMMAHISSTWRLERDDEGRVNSKFSFDPKLHKFDFAVKVLCRADRRLYFQTGNKATRVKIPHYKSLWNVYVPLIPAAFKKYSDLPYSNWEPKAFKHLVHPELAAALGRGIPEGLDTVARLKLRNEAITVTTSGKPQGPEYSYLLNGDIAGYSSADSTRADAVFLHTIIQTWCMHPSNWRPLMVKDMVNWDNDPETLVSAKSVIMPFERVGKMAVVDTDTPW